MNLEFERNSKPKTLYVALPMYDKATSICTSLQM